MLIRTSGIMATTPHLKEQLSTYLDQCTPRELRRLNEVVIWTFYSNNDFGSLGLDLGDKVWKVASNVLMPRWNRVNEERYAIANYFPYNAMSIFDDTQHWLEKIEDSRTCSEMDAELPD